MKWLESTLGIIVEADGGIIQTGPFGSQLHQHEYQTDGVPVIMPKDISEGRVLTESVARVSEQTADRLARHKLQIGAIVLPRRGEIAKRAFIRVEQQGWLCGTGCLKIELNAESRLSPEFLYYYMEQDSVARWLEQHAVGTTMLNLNTQIVADLPIRYPRPDVQRQIVCILSAYDDLIENNRRRIGLLEEAARLLYREWFVYFRFPGHEHFKITNGLPDGWECCALGELAIDVSYGFTESASHEVEGPKFLRITDIVNGPIDWLGVPRCPISDEKLQRFLLSSGDIVVARTGATTGWARRIGRLAEPAVFASYLVRFRFDDKYRPEIAATFMESDPYKAFVRANLGGAAQPNASAVVLGSASVPVPTPALQKDFAEAVAPMYEQIDALMEQNQKLSEARDILLPRLMNGEIAV
jgi:type I restriction enzyme S subunit